MQAQTTTTALVYQDGVIDICEDEDVIDTLRPESGDTVRKTLHRAGFDGWPTGLFSPTEHGAAEEWELERR